MERYCFKEEKACVGWVLKYFSDCLCNNRDEVSFAVGMVSVACWGVAEVPQIITNFRVKSCHGVSLAFLLTWFAGDIFNLAGCLLEPATLPTQLYMALLYTIFTVVLLLQSVYYDWNCVWWKRRDITTYVCQVGEHKSPFNHNKHRGSDIASPATPMKAPPRQEFLYMSARSLARSSTPPFPSSSNLKVASSDPPALGLDVGSSEEEDESSTPHSSTKKSSCAGYGAFIAAASSLPLHGKALMDESYLGFAGKRPSLHEHVMESTFGQCLGWLMAAIYMGSRFPQIILNIKRGSVEGLNPLMFVFALIANVTYVGSIVARTMEWDKIRANLPWLLDAVACVLLDFFIIVQYIYYKCTLKRTRSSPRETKQMSNDYALLNDSK